MRLIQKMAGNAYVFLRRDDWRGFYDPAHSEVLDLLMEHDPIEIKATRTFNLQPNLVAEIPLGQIRVVLKNFGWRSFLHFLASPFMASKAINSFKAALHLLNNGLPTPKPLAAFEQRRWRLVKRNCYVTESLGPLPHVRDYLKLRPDGEAGAREVLALLGSYIRRMHDSGLFHRDLTLANFLLKDGELYLIDLNRSRLKKRMSFAQRLRDLATPELEESDRNLFLRYYLGDGERLELWSQALNLRTHLVRAGRKFRKWRRRVFGHRAPKKEDSLQAALSPRSLRTPGNRPGDETLKT